VDGFCRACFALASGKAGRCPACGSPRLIAHPELDALSIAHIDCDAFFAAIEKRDNPELEGKPVIIGGGRRGVVSTACYVARPYGVHSAQPMFKALRNCPHAVVIRPDHRKYSAEGKRIRALMQEATPLVQPFSIDEAFLDLTGTERLHGGPPALTLARLQQRILDEVGVTVSVGLSHNKFLAKTASDLDKPHGFAVIGRAESLDFLATKPVDFVYGVGPAFARTLAGDGFRTLADIRRAGDKEMARRYGEGGLRLSRLARGEDDRPVSPDRKRKSASAETTFDTDIADLAALEDRLWPLCVKLADRAKADGIAGQVVTLKLKRADHRILTRRRALSAPTQLADTLFRTGSALLADAAGGAKFRLIGIGLSELAAPGGDAGDLFDEAALKRAAAERASDAARAKFGGDAVVKGRVLRGREGS